MQSFIRITFYVGLYSSRRPNSPTMVDLRRETALALVGVAFPKGLTAVRAVGQWEGLAEPNLRIEVVAEDTADTVREWARETARALAESLHQDAVAVSFDAVDFEIVGLAEVDRRVA